MNHRYIYGIIKKTTTEAGEVVNSIGRGIFKAIHEGKWLIIEYRNKQGVLKKYWIGVYDIDTHYKGLRVEGLHLGSFQNRIDLNL